MRKSIEISDDIYRALKREKGDRSFSEVVRSRLEEGRRIADVAGAGVLDAEVRSDVREDIERASETTLDRFDDETE